MDDLKERVAKLEERVDKVEKQVQIYIDAVNARMTRFEEYCKENQQLMRDALQNLDERIDKFLNHQIHELESKIEEAKNSHKTLSRWDWVKIVVVSISAMGSIVVALIQSGHF